MQPSLGMDKSVTYDRESLNVASHMWVFSKPKNKYIFGLTESIVDYIVGPALGVRCQSENINK